MPMTRARIANYVVAQPFASAGIADIELLVQDATIGLSTDGIDLTQANTLVVQDATVGLTTDSIALTQANTLAVDDATIALGAESPTLTQANTLAVQDATVALSTDGIDLTQANTLAVADALIALGAENVTLDVGITLIVADALIALVADSPTLTDVTESAAPPPTDTWSPGGGGFRTSSRRWRAVERSLQQALDRKERKPERLTEEQEPETEPPRPQVSVVGEALEEQPDQLPTPTPLPRIGGYGKVDPVRYVVTQGTFSPVAGSHAAVRATRRAALYARLEPTGIHNPTEEEVYLTIFS